MQNIKIHVPQSEMGLLRELSQLILKILELGPYSLTLFSAKRCSNSVYIESKICFDIYPLVMAVIGFITWWRSKWNQISQNPLNER